LFWWPGIIITALLASVFIIIEANVKSIAYVLFLASFENFLRHRFELVTYTALLVCAFIYITRKPRAEKKKFLFLAVAIIVYLLYSLLISHRTLGAQYLALLRHILLLFLICNLKEDLDFKTLVYVFIWGILVASVIGLFVNSIPNLAFRTMEHRFSGLTRFGALTGNPNRLHPHIFVAINGLFILDFRKQISKKTLVPLFAILFALGLTTISRTFCFAIVINLVCYVGLKLWYDRNAAFKQIAMIMLAALTACLVLHQYTLANLMRCGIIEERAIVQRQTPPRQDTDQGVHPDHILWHGAEDFEDPGRQGIWRRNIEEWLSTPRTILLGHGYGSSNFGMPHTHNLYIFLLVKTGVIGVLLFIFFLFTLFHSMYKVKKYKFELVTLLFLVIFACHSIFELRFPAITGFIFFYMFIISIESRKEDYEGGNINIEP